MFGMQWEHCNSNQKVLAISETTSCYSGITAAQIDNLVTILPLQGWLSHRPQVELNHRHDQVLETAVGMPTSFCVSYWVAEGTG